MRVEVIADTEEEARQKLIAWPHGNDDWRTAEPVPGSCGILPDTIKIYEWEEVWNGQS